MKVRVTYLCHSGFLLEWEACYWLFDYYRGSLPELLPEKKLLVFCSHSHGDHFNPEIFCLIKTHQKTEYIFSKELKKALSKEQKKRQDSPLPEVCLLPSGEDIRVSDGKEEEIFVHALPSTDCGAGFYLEYQGKAVYHAGDLHWWIWPREPEEDNRQMTGSYKKAMEYVKGRQLDLAFTPLDPRQEEYYDKGLTYLLEIASVRYVFPMHFWEDFTVIPRYLRECGGHGSETEIVKIEKDGQSWEVCI